MMMTTTTKMGCNRSLNQVSTTKTTKKKSNRIGLYLIQFVLFLSLNARLFFYLSGHFMMFGRLPHQPTNQPPLSSMCTYIEQIKYHSHRWCRYYTTKPNQTKPKRKKKYKGLFGFMNCCFFFVSI